MFHVVLSICDGRNMVSKCSRECAVDSSGIVVPVTLANQGAPAVGVPVCEASHGDIIAHLPVGSQIAVNAEHITTASLPAAETVHGNSEGGTNQKGAQRARSSVDYAVVYDYLGALATSCDSASCRMPSTNSIAVLRFHFMSLPCWLLILLCCEMGFRSNCTIHCFLLDIAARPLTLIGILVST